MRIRVEDGVPVTDAGAEFSKWAIQIIQSRRR